MKRIILISLFISLALSSCIKHMEEVEATMIAGSWARVDENNMASAFVAFDRGYMYEYNQGDEYYFLDNAVWGTPFSSLKSASKYKYTLVDGKLHYNNYYEDICTDVIRVGDAIILSGDKYQMLNEINQQQYSRIIPSVTNKTYFDYRGEYVEWDYEIENPVQGFKLQVLEAPEWCGGIDGITVTDDKISFYADSTILSTEGKFKFSYRTAPNVDIKVWQVAPPHISLEYTSINVDFLSTAISLRYTILNAENLKHTVKTNVDWLRVYVDDGNLLMISVDSNFKDSSKPRTGVITITCGNVSASCTVYQEGNRYTGRI